MKILVGLSGGLDSTYAAHLLKEQGHDVVGASVIMHQYTEISLAEDAARVIGIPFITIDASDTFKNKVVKRFINDYINGRTPNPCIECNPSVKFGALCDYAKKQGFDKVSTGHYANIVCENGRFFVKADDKSGKDQSYVLWRLTQEQLSMLFLPLVTMDKEQIRKKASELGYKAAESKESQDICFIPDGDYASFIKGETGLSFSEGDFVDEKGNVIGRHKGIIHYTIGQRKGLGAFGRPMFVKELNPKNNTITLVESGSEYMDHMTVGELNFMKLEYRVEGEIRALCKVRYAAKPTPCSVRFDEGLAYVTFEKETRAITPGQSAVFYDGDDVLFGGIILK